jgi:hypothetical protein
MKAETEARGRRRTSPAAALLRPGNFSILNRLGLFCQNIFLPAAAQKQETDMRQELFSKSAAEKIPLNREVETQKGSEAAASDPYVFFW